MKARMKKPGASSHPRLIMPPNLSKTFTSPTHPNLDPYPFLKSYVLYLAPHSSILWIQEAITINFLYYSSNPNHSSLPFSSLVATSFLTSFLTFFNSFLIPLTLLRSSFTTSDNSRIESVSAKTGDVLGGNTGNRRMHSNSRQTFWNQRR